MSSKGALSLCQCSVLTADIVDMWSGPALGTAGFNWEHRWWGTPKSTAEVCFNEMVYKTRVNDTTVGAPWVREAIGPIGFKVAPCVVETEPCQLWFGLLRFCGLATSKA